METTLFYTISKQISSCETVMCFATKLSDIQNTTLKCFTVKMRQKPFSFSLVKMIKSCLQLQHENNEDMLKQQNVIITQHMAKRINMHVVIFSSESRWVVYLMLVFACNFHKGPKHLPLLWYWHSSAVVIIVGVIHWNIGMQIHAEAECIALCFFFRSWEFPS